MECRAGCGACCIAPSISTPIPGLGRGKRGGERCPHLDENNLCKIFGKPERPAVCSGFQAEELFCGTCREEAMKILSELEGLDNS
ncbi:MAG: YkgJ family cysteine cluster protein [Marinilabiliaceae bacterium]|nr:YkgJ family cysteine cluster protein [Bacteroidales bacterium]MCR5696976.1 YkgJ family cysteine cluster protein [Marinilabiliaceae bacterium]